MRAKLHSTYFKHYFQYKDIHANTMIVEAEYVDRDYMEDFASYYVKCFRAPSDRCTRIHFFRSEFTEAQVDAFLRGEDRQDFLKTHLNDDNYLGFIVVKPLPQTFVGRTCLRTYRTQGTGRHFPSLRTYDVHLFGVKLSLESLAFQEQDIEVARCATAALWSAFQGTAKKFGHPVPSPVEITKYAVALHGERSRTLPAKDGLTLEQIADAIRKVNLEPHLVNVYRSATLLQAEAYAYLRAGIPTLLVVNLVDTKDKRKMPRNVWRSMGSHAVALTGYHLSDQPPQPYGSTSISFRATRIDKFYAHDDQVGPFSRMVLSPPGQTHLWKPRRGSEQTTYYHLETSWYGDSEEIGSVHAIPETLVVPLYPKMRVTFREALAAVKAFDATIMGMSSIGRITLQGPFEWDLFLTTNYDLTTDILENQPLTGDYAKNILSASMPRYIWRAIAYQNDQPQIELLFDATAILQGKFFLRAIEYDHNLLAILRTSSTGDFADKNAATRAIFTWFRENPYSA